MREECTDLAKYRNEMICVLRHDYLKIANRLRVCEKSWDTFYDYKKKVRNIKVKKMNRQKRYILFYAVSLHF